MNPGALKPFGPPRGPGGVPAADALALAHFVRDAVAAGLVRDVLHLRLGSMAAASGVATTSAWCGRRWSRCCGRPGHGSSNCRTATSSPSPRPRAAT